MKDESGFFVICERDGQNCDSNNYPDNPIMFEQYVKGSDFQKAMNRARALSERYGRCVVVRVMDCPFEFKDGGTVTPTLARDLGLPGGEP